MMYLPVINTCFTKTTSTTARTMRVKTEQRASMKWGTMLVDAPLDGLVPDVRPILMSASRTPVRMEVSARRKNLVLALGEFFLSIIYMFIQL
jgi:hypothetical protein